jgi:hypothetical protein
MNLKFPFKFKHRLADNVFFAEKENVDTVKVSWDTEHFITSRKYDMSLVEHFVDCGGWVIIEEPSPVVSITQDEYDSMVEEINLLQELLASANNRIAELENKYKFKPIANMTFDDWVVARREGHVFKTRGGETTTVIGMDKSDTKWSVHGDKGWYKLDGTFHPDDEVPEDIIERIS